MAGGQGRKGLLALASLLGHVLHLPVCRHKMLLQSRFRLPRLLDALLGLGDIGSLNRRLLRQQAAILARLGLLLAGHFELISNVGELSAPISLSLRMSRDRAPRRHPASFPL